MFWSLVTSDCSGAIYTYIHIYIFIYINKLDEWLKDIPDTPKIDDYGAIYIYITEELTCNPRYIS